MIARFDDGGAAPDGLDRRRFLAGAGGVLAVLAGCTESDDGGDGTEPSPKGGQGTTTTGTSTTKDTDDPGTTTAQSTATGGQETATGGGTTANETTGDEGNLDLREANVVDVALERRDGSIRFDVTLYHDDDGEDGYANWWQVETLDGEHLGRRELLHAHSTAPFTRSETIEVPDDVTCVVVRGHDQTHGYGGQAAIVNLDSEKAILVRQGPEKRSFDASACP